MDTFAILGFVFAMIAFSQIFVLRKEIEKIKQRLKEMDIGGDQKV